jgi:hypothetical protein
MIRVAVGVVAALLVNAAVARADLTTATCLAAKLKEWGWLRKCQATEAAKALRSLPADPPRCDLRWAAKLAALSYKAAVVGVACRFGDGGDGTVTDYDTGLQWEKKTDDGSIHDKDNFYPWVVVDGYPDLFTGFLRTLNHCDSTDGTTITGGFAGHCDWRIPTSSELGHILDPNAPGCGSGGVCFDTTVFGPLGQEYDWSATYADPSDVWVADHQVGRLILSSVYNGGGAHAVRNRF